MISLFLISKALDLVVRIIVIRLYYLKCLDREGRVAGFAAA